MADGSWQMADGSGWHGVEHFPYVNDFARDGRRGDHRRAHQKRPPGGTALAAFEIPVGRRGRHLAAFELVRVHTKAHGAAWPSPLEPGRHEHLVQTLRFGGPADRARA